ncbi:MAG TPA: TonB-dependent receptor [Pyrinomonadaceae bacterium]|nr:TonB-dependent receptor [Pyrinomonadaceae bacterium]
MKNLLVFLILLGVSLAHGNQDQSSTQKTLLTLTGRVVDARTGEPIARVRVIANSVDQSTTTDEKGEFTFTNLPGGPIDLYITTVNYGLVRKTVSVEAGRSSELIIALNEDAAALTESVTVTSDPFASAEANIASEQTLNKRELQSLSSVLMGDPVRAAQALPGIVANDDFRSEFAVRGAGFNRVGLYLDGVLTENFVHTVQGGYPDTGSLSVINTDTVDTLSVMSGAFPAKYGHRSAAILDIETRDGNRVKPAGRFSVALSGLSGVVDGPFADGRGSYLVAGRKSYLGYLIRRVNDENEFTNNPPIIDFADLQGKLLYDVTSNSQVGFSLIFGNFNYDRNQDRNLLSVNNVFRGSSRNLLFNAHWSYTPNSKFFFQTRFFGLRSEYLNENLNEITLLDGERTQYGVRSDANFTSGGHRLQAGLYVRSLRVNNFNQVFVFFPDPVNIGSFNRRGTEQAYYAQDTWSSEKYRLSLTGGGRLERGSMTGETLVSPRGSMSWSPVKDWQVRAAAGIYRQFPDFEQMFGGLGNPNLRSDKSIHYNASVERRFGERTRVLFEIYDREDHNLVFGFSEPFLSPTGPGFAVFRFENAWRSHARGFELAVQRRSANKLTGWISYAYSTSRMKHLPTGLTFPSDSDQRHTVNVYGSYRFNETWNLSSEWRYGSGQPVPAFVREVGPLYFLSGERNGTRIPAYSRVDVRLNKAFLFGKWKLTVNGEVINLLNRDNLRFAGFGGFGFDGRVFGGLDQTLPILPSAGVVIEF